VGLEWNQNCSQMEEEVNGCVSKKPSLPGPNADTCIRFRYLLKILQKRWVFVGSFSMSVSRSITR
jgi:hypothetical protein